MGEDVSVASASDAKQGDGGAYASMPAPAATASEPPTEKPDIALTKASTLAADSPNLSDYLAFYSAFRDYAKHEDTLINYRLGWILTIHGFLYATYGFTLQKELEVLGHNGVDLQAPALCYSLTQADFFLFCIAIVGMSISILGWLSISAAKRALASIDQIFQTNHTHTLETTKRGKRTTDMYLIPGLYRFPAIQGGGLRENVSRGLSASTLIPWILCISWIASLTFLAVVYFHMTDLSCLRLSPLSKQPVFTIQVSILTEGND